VQTVPDTVEFAARDLLISAGALVANDLALLAQTGRVQQLSK
jgi:hypothetical protein